MADLKTSNKKRTKLNLENKNTFQLDNLINECILDNSVDIKHSELAKRIIKNNINNDINIE